MVKILQHLRLVIRAVFKWLSKVITWLRLLRLVIGLKDSRQFFNQWEAKPKPITPCTRDFSRALSELQVIARIYDWFIALFAPVVTGRSNCFGFGFSTVIWKPLYYIYGCYYIYTNTQSAQKDANSGKSSHKIPACDITNKNEFLNLFKLLNLIESKLHFFVWELREKTSNISLKNTLWEKLYRKAKILS